LRPSTCRCRQRARGARLVCLLYSNSLTGGQHLRGQTPVFPNTLSSVFCASPAKTVAQLYVPFVARFSACSLVCLFVYLNELWRRIFVRFTGRIGADSKVYGSYHCTVLLAVCIIKCTVPHQEYWWGVHLPYLSLEPVRGINH